MIGRRHRGWLGALLALATLIATGARADDADPASEPVRSWYAASIARGDAGFLVTHYWSKGVRLRAETVAAGRRLITLVDETTYYVIDPTRAEAIGIERSPLSIRGDASRPRPFADELGVLLRAGGERVGEEELGGRTVARYQLTNQAGRVQVWVRTDLDLPVRIDRYVRATGGREQTDYIDWIRNPAIDDSFFEPPKGIEIERVGYEDYVRRTMAERLGPAPPFYAHLLHGEPED